MPELLAQVMHALHEEVWTPLAVLMVTDPWEAARRLYLMIQYTKLLYALWKHSRKSK